MRENQSKGFAILLLFVSPAIALFSAVKHLEWKHKKLVLILFITIYGSLLKYGEGSDAAVYYQLLNSYDNMSFSEFFLRLEHIITFNPLPGSPNDVYVHVLAFFSSSILGMHDVFFPIVGFIYGYFYVTAMSKILVWEKGRKLTLSLLLIVILFIIHRSVTSFQTVRTWTGMWVLFNGVLGYHQTRQKKYVLLMCCAPLIHFAYFVIALPAFAALYIRKIPAKVIIAVYIISFFTSFNPGGILDAAKENSLAETKVGAYYRENAEGEGIDPIMERMEESNAVWYAKYGKTDSVYYGGHAFAFLLILSGYFKKKMTQVEIGLFGTGLMMAILANFGAFSYAFYSRTMANAVVYILGAVSLLAIRGAFSFRDTHNPRLMRFLNWVCILVFVPKMVFFVADLLVMTSVFILGLPFIGWVSSDLNISIREIMGEFL
ncbi:hypothetical protein HYN59_08330 [Flavobacterium album]|uniref:EpsG family protein n=1 Tax=Flavobacterium album TaxID=2175091 RepID=A0A2S1QXK6_9FLAO|nr:EpsG family protein [Flavobacterium album]AWH85128.1 hypothetical protein HYN59_08330 [Flavobacterium album]